MDKACFACDLHTHTRRSDGMDSYETLIDRAVERGLKVIAITDHDIVPELNPVIHGCEVDLKTYGKSGGLFIIPGIEFSCNTDVEDVHVLGLDCDFSHPGFEKQAKLAVQSKIDGYSELMDRLSKKGMPVTMEEVLNYGGIRINPEEIQKKRVFELMADKGYAKDWGMAKLMVRRDPKLQVKRKKPDAEEVIRLIKESGGIAVLAHPYLIEEPVLWKGKLISRAEYIQILIDAGLDGIEASYAYHKTSYGGSMTAEEIEEEVKRKYADGTLFISGGSDFHNDRAKGVSEEKCRELGEKGISFEEFLCTPLAGRI